MKIIYSKQLLESYINGDEVLGYDIEALENNPNFMMQAIKMSKDKNLYNLCSEAVKINYDFVCFIAHNFKEDGHFVSMVADHYLQLKLNFKKSFELSIMLSDLLTDGYEDKYKLLRTAASERIFLEVECFLLSIDELNVKQLAGKGFFYIMDSYEDSKIIMDFLAKKMVESIFYNPSLEKFLHSRFKSYEQIKQKGVTNMIIDYLSTVDSYLSGYIQKNIELVYDLKRRIQNVGKGWEHYVTDLNKRRVFIIYDEVNSFLDKNNITSFSCDELVMYVAQKLDLLKLFIYYSSDSIPNEGLDFNYLYDLSSVNDYGFLIAERYTLNLMKELFKNDVIPTNLDDYHESPKRAVVIPFGHKKS